MRSGASGDERMKVGRWRSAIRRELDRIGHSETFASSRRLRGLLDYLAGETVEGRGGGLNESSVGNAVYRRVPPYDPRIDSTARVEVRRLRQKLQTYYAGEGRADAIRIDVPVGSYVPLFSEVKPRPAEGGPLLSDIVGDGGGDRDLFEPGDGTLVAIMPFRPLNRGARAESFATGLTAEIAFVLGQERGITVLAGDQVRQSREDLVAHLGVSLFVDGTVRSTGNMVRVTVEVSYMNGILAWADRIDAPKMGELRLQEMIAATLISHARVDNSIARSWEVRPKTMALERNARVNRARLMLSRQTPESIREALSRFGRVAETQPDYSRGHSGRADCLCDLYRLELVDAETAGREALEAAERAKACDPKSIEALTALATSIAWFGRRQDEAFRWFDEAVALGGGMRAFRGEAMLHAALGRFEDAELALARARDIEPISTLLDVSEATFCFMARRYDAIEAAMRRLERSPMPVPFEAVCYSALGLALGGAREAALSLLPSIERGCRDYPAFALVAEELRALLGVEVGLSDQAAPEHGRTTHYGRASLAMALGEEDHALSELASALAGREAATFWLGCDPRFDSLRRRGAFGSLLAGTWREAGPSAGR